MNKTSDFSMCIIRIGVWLKYSNLFQIRCRYSATSTHFVNCHFTHIVLHCNAGVTYSTQNVVANGNIAMRTRASVI